MKPRIGCTRCVRACEDLRGVGALGFVFDDTGKIQVGSLAPTLAQSACRFCTACVEVCPTGAIVDKRLAAGSREEALVPCRSACPAGLDVPDAKLRAKVESVLPRVRAALVQTVQTYATGMTPGAPPNGDALSQALQRETDRVLGQKGAKVLLGTMLIN